MSAAIDLSGVTDVAFCSLAWESTVPTNTTLTVDTSTSTLETAAEFTTRSTTTLGADLRIVGSATVYPGAALSGAGSLIIEPGSTLTGEGDVDVNVINNGNTQPGFSPGTLNVAGFTQTSTGTLTIELAGTADGQYDVLNVTGSAVLAGALNVSLLGGFEPSSDTWIILEAGGGITGSFESITAGYTARLILGDTAVQLLFGMIIGDMDGSNGATEPNGNDINPFVMALVDRPAYEAAFPGLDADARGDCAQDDGLLNGNDINPFVDLLIGGSPAVPEPATLSLLILGMLAMIRRRQ